MGTMILFKKVRDSHGRLSNMSPHSVDEYQTAEAKFQASRFADAHIQSLIRECPSPMGAKMIAKAHASRMILAPRSPEDVSLMREVVWRKVAQHPNLRAPLLATGDAEIVEDVSARPNESGLFWGAKVIGTPPTCVIHGQNWLGRIWMDLRQELRRTT